MAEKNMAFSEKATQELHIFTEAVKEIVNTSFSAFKKEDVELAGTVEPLEEVIDDLNMELKTRHIRRLREGKCTIDLGFVHSDITTNYERIADHCSNIAVCLIQVKQEGFDTHEYLGTIKREDNEQLKKQYAVFKEKYRQLKDQEIYISFEGISHILDEVEKARRRLIANVNFEVAIEMLLVTIKENGKVW